MRDRGGEERRGRRRRRGRVVFKGRRLWRGLGCGEDEGEVLTKWPLYSCCFSVGIRRFSIAPFPGTYSVHCKDSEPSSVIDVAPVWSTDCVPRP